MAGEEKVYLCCYNTLCPLCRGSGTIDDKKTLEVMDYLRRRWDEDGIRPKKLVKQIERYLDREETQRYLDNLSEQEKRYLDNLSKQESNNGEA